MDTQNIDSLLSQMRAMAAQASSSQDSGATAGVSPEGQTFETLLKSYVDEVNSTQEQASNMAKDFEKGDPNANLQDVMVSLQKANVTFQTMVQVRNRLVTAYQEIMGMQV